MAGFVGWMSGIVYLCSWVRMAGGIALCDVDCVMMHEANGPLAIRDFESMDGTRVFDPEKMVVVFDHCTPPSTEKLANIHAFIRACVREQGVRFYEGGRGVCHQLLVESGMLQPGFLVLGRLEPTAGIIAAWSFTASISNPVVNPNA